MAGIGARSRMARGFARPLSPRNQARKDASILAEFGRSVGRSTQYWPAASARPCALVASGQPAQRAASRAPGARLGAAA